MDPEEIFKLFEPGQVVRHLSEDEKKSIADEIKVPFLLNKKIKKIVDEELEVKTMEQLEDIQMYPCMIPVFKAFIVANFIKTLVDAGTPIGPITSDAIGQQATQALLNTFHQAGSAKSSGSGGIMEVISIAAKRSVFYSSFHFKNNCRTQKDLINDRVNFIENTIETLCSKKYPIVPIKVNFHKQLSEYEMPTSVDESNALFEAGYWWWYKISNHDRIYKEKDRTAIRITLDVVKLYEFNISTTEIANIISRKKFEVLKEKHSKEKIAYDVVVIPSPTFIGIIDIFTTSTGISSGDEIISNSSEEDIKTDHFLTTAIVLREFRHLHVSGIPGIKNFYAVPVSVLSMVREIKPCPEGAWLYFNPTRFSGIPVQRLVHLLEDCGLEVDKNTANGIDYHSHKVRIERRTLIEVKCYDYDSGFHEIRLSAEKKTKGIKFFDIVGSKVNETKVLTFLLDYPQDNYDHHIDHDLNFSDRANVIQFIEGINKKESRLSDFYDIIAKINPEFLRAPFFSMNVVYNNGEMNVKKYIHLFRLKQFNFVLRVKTDYINSLSYCSTLEHVITNFFACRNYSLPEKYRIPHITELEVAPIPKRRILVKSHLFFRDDFYISEPEKTDKKKKPEKLTPMDRLINFVSANVTNPDYLKYVYAETQGTALRSLCNNPMIDSRRTYCNNFPETLDVFGIEALRNLLAFDLIAIINGEGYINVKYPILVADILTANWLNPMTSEGNSSQGKGVLSAVTFDNVTKYIKRASLLGKTESTKAASTAVFIGSEISLGTGYSKVGIDQNAITSVDVLRKTFLSNVREIEDDVSEHDVEDREPEELVVSKFPRVAWVFEAFVNKNIMFYFDRGINTLKRYTYKEYSLPSINTYRKLKKFYPTIAEVREYANR